MSVRRFRFIDGEVREVTEHRRPTSPLHGGTQAYGAGNPLTSLAMSCHPDQAGEYNAAMQAHGVQGVEYDQRGRCKITSRRGRVQAMRAFGLHDRDGGYGDG